MRVFWDKLVPTGARSGSGSGRNIPERGLKSSECLKPMSTWGILCGGNISVCNWMEKVKTRSGMKIQELWDGSTFPAGVDDPGSSWKIQILKVKFNVLR